MALENKGGYTMSVNAFASRPAPKSIGAAAGGLLVTLFIFVVVFVAFLIAPLLLLLVAFIAYLVMRPRPSRNERVVVVDGVEAPIEPSGFGAGAR